MKPSIDSRAGGNQYVYLVRVVTGEYTDSRQDYDAARNNHDASARKVDSLVDDVNNPTKYVVVSSDQAYPEYLITFW